MTQLLDGMPNPRFPWFTAEDYAVDLEFKDQWHFVNSHENRLRLASYWTATMFLIDMAWDLGQVYDQLDRLPRQGWDYFKHNLNFMFEANPQSYKDRVVRASKVVFGDNWRLSPLVGKPFTQDEVRDQQPDTEDYQDPDNLDPAMFPAAATSASQQAICEDVPPC